MKYYNATGKFKEGDPVFANANPSQKLLVRRYLDRIYYCRSETPPLKDVVFFERELTSWSQKSQ